MFPVCSVGAQMPPDVGYDYARSPKERTRVRAKHNDHFKPFKCPWDTHYQFSIETLLSNKELFYGCATYTGHSDWYHALAKRRMDLRCQRCFQICLHVLAKHGGRLVHRVGRTTQIAARHARAH